MALDRISALRAALAGSERSSREALEGASSQELEQLLRDRLLPRNARRIVLQLHCAAGGRVDEELARDLLKSALDLGGGQDGNVMATEIVETLAQAAGWHLLVDAALKLDLEQGPRGSR